MLRLIITSILGLLIIFGAITIARKMVEARNEPKPVETKAITAVSVIEVNNETKPITLSTSGNLMARDRLEVFSEVTGIFESSDHTFKPGSYYRKGEILLRINSEEHEANIRAQKSALFNQIVLFLPDLKFDYPESFLQWENYVGSFEIYEPLPDLPEPVNEKEKLFIVGRGVYTTYYNIKNLEERLGKYVVRAPFSGVITESNVQPGTLIRNGQKLAQMISSGAFEMEVNVNVAYMDLLKIGKTVVLHSLERTKSWEGRVVRVDGRVDQSSQTIKVFISVYGKGLKEGMFLEADLNIESLENAFEVDRKLLVETNGLFVVQDSILDIVQINPAFFKEASVIIRGLQDGTQLLARPVPGAYPGMKVEIRDF